MKFISILRGINVSGQKKIKMADLKALYEGLGFSNVSTYIQSGNVLFECEQNDKSPLKTQIEQAITKAYSFDVPVDVRTVDEFKAVLANLPFDGIELEKDGTQVMVTFLAGEPHQDKIDAIATYVKAPEKLVVDGSVVYLHCPNGYGKSKLTNVFIEKKLAVCATTRNLKSVTKLCELAG
ncbi:MAG: DUF1697 domain-containing protein [Algicola sp.]|nr:DUF1697 domain-containing protein [Algicola sp.]